MTGPQRGGSYGFTRAERTKTGNNAARLSNNSHRNPLRILNNHDRRRILGGMKHMRLWLVTALLFSLASTASAADCFADYKAKRDNPLRLHYGVVQVAGPCNAADAQAEIAARLEQNGWTLLNVVSLFDRTGLEERQSSAGQYYLRF
jgi:hypothetical protein